MSKSFKIKIFSKQSYIQIFKILLKTDFTDFTNISAKNINEIRDP